MSNIKISAVSYTNTKPFIDGITRSDILHKIDLSLDIPSDCAAKVITEQVDIGLMPVGVLPLVPNGHIIGNFCIGSVGAVNSVFIFSHVPANEIKTIRLDSHSRTSNLLAQVLLKFYWKQEVIPTTDPEVDADAIVLIGDRTFGKAQDHLYAYDMGQAWMDFTGLPFTYAAWIANKPIPEDFVAEFDEALKLGVEGIKALLPTLPAYDHFDMEDYLLHKLDFSLTDDKRKAIELFLSYIARL